jgi:phage terminase small subunit
MAYLRKGQEPPVKGKGAKLSSKMELFVSEYLVDLNATEAVRRAGYKTTNPNRLGTELLNHPIIKERIDAALSKRLEINEVKADYLINKLLSIIEGTEKSNPTACLRAIELAGKSIALWKERQEISGPDGGAIEMEQKVKEDVRDFTSSLSRLIERGGESEVLKFPKREGDSEA